MSNSSEEMASVVHASAQALPNLRALGWSMELRLHMLPGIRTQLPALRTLGVSSIEPVEDEDQKMEEASTDGIDPTATSPLILALCRAGWLTFQPEWGPDGRLPVTHHVLRRLPCVSGISGGMLLARSFPSAEHLAAAADRLSSFARAYALQFDLSEDDVPTSSSPSSPAACYAASAAGVSAPALTAGSSPARAGSGSEPFTTSAWWQALPPGSLRNVLNAHVQVVASPALLTCTGLAPWPRQVITHIAQALPDLLGLSIMSHMPEYLVSIAQVMLPRMPHVQRLWISWARDPNDFSPAAIAALSATLMAVCHAAPSGGALRWVIALGMPEVVVHTCNKLLSVQRVGRQVRVGTDHYATLMEPMQTNGEVQMQGQAQPHAVQQLH